MPLVMVLDGRFARTALFWCFWCGVSFLTPSRSPPSPPVALVSRVDAFVLVMPLATIDVDVDVVVALFVNARGSLRYATDGKNTPQNAAEDAAASPAKSDKSLSQLSRDVIVSCEEVPDWNGYVWVNRIS